MTIQRMRSGGVESRSGVSANWPSGWGWSDPSAIPPPGMYQMQRAGVPVTAHTSLQVDTVFTSLRVISNAMIKMGDPMAYKLGLSADNEPYKIWQAVQPAILTNTWGKMWQF